MEKSPAQADLGVVREMAQLYEHMDRNEQKDEYDLLHTFLLLARTISSLQAHTSHSARNILAEVPEHVNAIALALKPYFEAQIGPAIGRLAPRAMQEIKEDIRVHQERIEIMEQEQHDPKNVSGIYDLLVAHGWNSEVSKKEWIANETGRAIEKAAEQFFIGKLEYELHRVQALFDRFVTHDGTLS